MKNDLGLRNEYAGLRWIWILSLIVNDVCADLASKLHVPHNYNLLRQNNVTWSERESEIRESSTFVYVFRNRPIFLTSHRINRVHIAVFSNHRPLRQFWTGRGTPRKVGRPFFQCINKNTQNQLNNKSVCLLNEYILLFYYHYS